MLARRGIWVALGAGLLVPVTYLSITSYNRLQDEIRSRRRDQEREFDRRHLDHVRSVRQILERSFEDRIAAALSRITSGGEGDLFADPFLSHPFVLDENGLILFPALSAPAPAEPGGVWGSRIEEAALLEARAPGDPLAVAAFRDCLDRSPDGAAARRAALLLGAWHARAGRFPEALETYEKGWLRHEAGWDRDTALLGAMRVVCQARVGRPADASVAAAAFLEGLLSVDAWGDPAGSAPLVRLVADTRPPRQDLPRREAALWEQWDRMDQRILMRRILAAWGFRAIEDKGREHRIVLVSRVAQEGTQALAFMPAERGKGGTGALLDLPRIEAWLAGQITADTGLTGCRLVPAQEPVDPAAHARELIPARMPLWRLEAGPPGPIAPDEGHEGPAGRSLVLAALALSTLSFVLILWALSRERELQQMKGQFVSAASHELRTPLALIQTAGETLRMGRVRDPEKVQGYLAVIDRESRRLSRLMANLLDFSRMEAGKRVWTPRRIDTPPFLVEVLQELRQTFADPAIAWRAEIPDFLPPLHADPEAIRLVLANLIENAVKYSPRDDEKQVIVRAGVAEQTVWVEVEDRGIGIPPEDRRRVFERFYRADGARRLGIPGSGIGLSLVRQAVEAQGGSVEIHQASPNGTRFRILLPVFAEKGAP